MTTYCDDCDNVEPSTSKSNPRYWACMKHLRLNDGFVSQHTRVTVPYLYCRDVNGGACPLFKPLEVGQSRLNLTEKK